MSRVRAVGVALACVCAAASSIAAGAVPSADLQAAAISIDARRSVAEDTARFCLSRHPGDNDTSKFVVHFWRADELALRSTVDNILPGLSAAQRQSLEQARAAAQAKTPAKPDAASCQQFFTDLRSGALALRTLEAAAARTLSDAADEDEGLRIVKRDSDIAIGCMKGLYNRGARGFDSVESVCACLNRALLGNYTSAQIDVWQAAIRDGSTSALPDTGDEAVADATRAEIAACGGVE